MRFQSISLQRRNVLRTLGSLSLAAALPGAMAQEAYPTRPIRFIVPFPPGSGAELTARFMGQKLSELIGQSVLVEPRGGGNGFIGGQAVLSAPRDG
jgi:tripartite-type tricarboxylate transporter receptor subunit TctC